jgi:hypothetical protein
VTWKVEVLDTDQALSFFLRRQKEMPPHTPASKIRAAGGARTPGAPIKKPARFAALDSDSEQDLPPKMQEPRNAADIYAAMLAADPHYQAMLRGVSWADIEIPVRAPVIQDQMEIDIDRWDGHAALSGNVEPSYTESHLWNEPFAQNLEAHLSDVFDTSALTDEEYAAFMTRLYAAGWSITQETRTVVQARPDTLPPRLWVPPGRFDGLTEDKEKVKSLIPLASPGTDKGRKKGAPVPRFCRAAGGCQEAGCRYTHGDTIPRVNRPCGFGEACGATDPTGVKRSQCLYMHPGETWTEGMVIHRPSV